MTDLRKLAALEQLRSLKSQRDLAALRAEESALRTQIAKLQEHRRGANAAEPALVPMRRIGADVLWHTWINRTQAELNTELAKVLARKDPVARKARREIGRSETVAELRDAEAGALRRARQSAALQTLLDLGSVTAASSSGSRNRTR